MTAATLPKLRIKTAHSEYLIDQNAGTFSRTRVHEHANDLSQYLGSDEAIEYRDIMSTLEPGNKLVITLPSGGWIRSTPIVSIEEIQ